METQQEFNAESSGCVAGRDIRETIEIKGDCGLVAGGGFHNLGTININYPLAHKVFNDRNGTGKLLFALGELLTNSEGKKLKHLDGVGALVTLIGDGLIRSSKKGKE